MFIDAWNLSPALKLEANCMNSDVDLLCEIPMQLIVYLSMSRSFD